MNSLTTTPSFVVTCRPKTSPHAVDMTGAVSEVDDDVLLDVVSVTDKATMTVIVTRATIAMAIFALFDGIFIRLSKLANSFSITTQTRHITITITFTFPYCTKNKVNI